MQTIFPLPQLVIAQIAAGEVIERPSYAVKELIENALDAHATHITVAIEESGLKKITVIDNGDGMSEEDIALCFLPHTTSKLAADGNFFQIRTLGFRGEALASVAAVANLTVASRQRNAIGGTRVVLVNGRLVEQHPVGMPVGTQVVVTNLFGNVPARKKFLKSAATEFRHISEVVMSSAISFPEVHFVLEHNKKVLLDMSPTTELIQQVPLFFGRQKENDFLRFAYDDGTMRIEGLVGKPHVASKQNHKQVLVVNNRVVTDRMIALAVKESFGTLLPSSSTPVFLLKVTLPHELIDVNIHPRKEQVHFVNQQMVFAALKQAVAEILATENITFNLAKFKQETSAKLGETQTFAAEVLREAVLPWDRGLGKKDSILQLYQTYLLVPTKEGIQLLDQHGAHERILYEQFLKTFAHKRAEQNILSKPVSMEVSATDAQLLDEYQDVFSNAGFSIEHFGATHYIVRAIPQVFSGRKIEKILRDMLTDLTEIGAIASVDSATTRMLMFLSCRAAVKAGDVLAQEQKQEIVKALEHTPNNATCPHGRPTKITITPEELHRSFRRK